MRKISLTKQELDVLKKVSKRLALFATVGTITVIGGVTIKNWNCSKIEKNLAKSDYLEDYFGTIGNKEISFFENDVFEKTKYAFVTVQDNQVPLDEIKKLRKERKEVGLIVSPTDYTYASIYKTVDAVKSFLEGTDYNCPILYNIGKYMGEDVLRANCLLAEEFCNKLSANGLYVGLYGTDEDMLRFDQKFRTVTDTNSIDLYDKVIQTDLSPTSLLKIKYQGTYNMLALENGIVLSKNNLVDVIQRQGLNEPARFREEYAYEVKQGDTLSSIARNYGIKLEDLKVYNNLETDEIYPEDKILIPNNYLAYEKDALTLTSTQDNIESETLNRIEKGIDVSAYQGEVDWNQVKETVDFAILKLCDFCHMDVDGNCELDERFIQNITACETLDIPVGVYYFSRATTEEEAIKEAKFVANKLKSYSLEYPVYLDIETTEQETLMEKDPTSIKNVITKALTILEEAGYFTGIYCNKSVFPKIEELSQKYHFWVTSNETYQEDVSFGAFQATCYPVLYIPNNKISMFQHSCNGKVEGIDGPVDIDYATNSLQKVIQQKKFNLPKQ